MIRKRMRISRRSRARQLTIAAFVVGLCIIFCTIVFVAGLAADEVQSWGLEDRRLSLSRSWRLRGDVEGKTYLLIAMIALLLLAPIGLAIGLLAKLMFQPDTSPVERTALKHQSEATLSMIRYFASCCRDPSCLVEANRRIASANFEFGYRKMHMLVEPSDISAQGKRLALRGVRTYSVHLCDEERYALARAAVLIFLAGGECASLDGFQAVIGRLSPLSAEAMDFVDMAHSAKARELGNFRA